ncbi:MAG: porin family protein [Bacteroidales bacterium]
MARFIAGFLFLMTLCGFYGKSQQFTFGPKVGFISSHLTTDQDSLLDEFRHGFQGGLFFRFYGDYFYFQPEIMYVTKGGVFDEEYQTLKQDIDLQSIDFPVIFGLKLGPEEFNFRVHAGPVASFIVQKTIETTGSGLVDPVKERNIKDSMLGAIVGLGLDILSFSLDVRYEYGWDNVYTPKAGDPNMKMRHEMFNVSLGYKFL